METITASIFDIYKQFEINPSDFNCSLKTFIRALSSFDKIS